MPTPKGKKSTQWWTCEDCSVTVLTKDAKAHSLECAISRQSRETPFVASDVVYTNARIENYEEIKDIKPSISNNIILIDQIVLQLCSIAIGEPVMIEPYDKSCIPIVRNAWPIYSHSTSTMQAIIPSNSVEINWKNKNNVKIAIKKFERIPSKAKTVEINYNDTAMLKNPEFKEFVKYSNINKIVSPHNSFQISFFGRNINLSISNIFTDSEEKHWFLIDEMTKWIFRSNQDDSCRSNNKKIIGGTSTIIDKIQSLLDNTLKNSFDSTNVNKTKCVLLYGPTGVGKSIICQHLSDVNNVNVVNIHSSEIYSKFYGETENTLKKYFYEAIDNSPSLIIIDDIDTLCSKKSSNSTEQEQRVLSTMAMLLENIHNVDKPVFVLATTNKLDTIDPILRRYGRIDCEIEVSVPDRNSRCDIMEKLFLTFPNSLTKNDIEKLADVTHGFVGADIANLNTQAMMHAIKTNMTNNNFKLKFADFEWALTQVKPSAMREVLIDIPNVKWDDIGGQEELKLKLKQAIEWPLKHGESFTRLGIKPPSGLLMYGPPGCSKTMIAKAIANESKLNFLSIKGPELFSKWVGESERAVREVFRKARQLAPSIIFFDEIDAISGERSSDNSGSNVQERVLAQILTELDGVSPLGNVSIVAATNRPDKIDSALLRPGRLDRIVYVPLPDDRTRRSILTIKFNKMPIGEDVCMNMLIEKTENFSGAEVQAVCHEAALKALEENIDCDKIYQKHFNMALQNVQPRTRSNLLKIYENFERSFL